MAVHGETLDRCADAGLGQNDIAPAQHLRGAPGGPALRDDGREGDVVAARQLGLCTREARRLAFEAPGHHRQFPAGGIALPAAQYGHDECQRFDRAHMK